MEVFEAFGYRLSTSFLTQGPEDRLVNHILGLNLGTRRGSRLGLRKKDTYVKRGVDA